MKRIGKNVLIFILGTVFSFIINVAAETLIDSGAVTYTNASTNQTTVNGALNELFSAVDINQRLGNTSISNIGNGTITGAISNLNTNVENVGNQISGFENKVLGYTYLSSTSNFNDYIETGGYVIPDSNFATTELNYPANGIGGMFHVQRAGDTVLQLYFAYTGLSDYIRLFSRHYYVYADFWGEWTEYQMVSK